MPNYVIGPGIEESLPGFGRKYARKEEDLTIVLWGDSLLAREQHTSVGGLDPTSLPPLMHSMKLDWHLWQGLDYPKPTFRRFDHPGTFDFRGDWTAAESDPLWDDSGYRPAITYWSDSPGAAIRWHLRPEDSAVNLIYRADGAGAQAEVAVEQGQGLVEVWDETTGAWVEGDGLRFSMKQSVGPRSGNTTYQRRLRLRRTEDQPDLPVTMEVRQAVEGSHGRLSIWGVERFRRDQGILTLVNSARGSHTLEMLVRSLENEVIDFQPDLIVLQLPLLNMVHVCPTVEYAVNWTRDVVWGDRPGAENHWALRRRLSGEGAPIEVLLLIPHHSQVHFCPDGSFADLGEGVTAEAIYDGVRNLVRAQGDVPALDLAAAFLDEIAADPTFGDPYQAMHASSPTGPTYTTDGVHQNDRGTDVYVRYLGVLSGE